MSTGRSLIDVSTFRRAAFTGSDSFDHFMNPDHSGCFACNSRMMLVKPIEVTDDYTLLEATLRLDDGTFVVFPDTWLVYPRLHVETLYDMPDNWTGSVKQAVRSLGIGMPFCTGENWGKEAGQTIKHAHTWVIGRGLAETGLISENTGLATIILRIKQHGILMPA